MIRNNLIVRKVRDFQDVEDAEFLIFYLVEAINQATIRSLRIFPKEWFAIFYYYKNKFQV